VEKSVVVGGRFNHDQFWPEENKKTSNKEQLFRQDPRRVSFNGASANDEYEASHENYGIKVSKDNAVPGVEQFVPRLMLTFDSRQGLGWPHQRKEVIKNFKYNIIEVKGFEAIGWRTAALPKGAKRN
jgi:hypothetical protein